MPSLISQSRQNAVTAVFKNLHDTFTREITVYKNAKAVSISSSPSFNGIYGSRSQSESIQFQTVSKSFKARVYFIKNEQEFLQSSGQNPSMDKIIFANGLVKIIVELDGFEFLKEARKVEFDGVVYSVRSGAIPEGLFQTQFYEFYLTPVNE